MKIEEFTYVKSEIMPLANTSDPWRTQINPSVNTTAPVTTSQIVGNTVSLVNLLFVCAEVEIELKWKSKEARILLVATANLLELKAEIKSWASKLNEDFEMARFLRIFLWNSSNCWKNSITEEWSKLSQRNLYFGLTKIGIISPKTESNPCKTILNTLFNWKNATQYNFYRIL